MCAARRASAIHPTPAQPAPLFSAAAAAIATHSRTVLMYSCSPRCYHAKIRLTEIRLSQTKASRVQMWASEKEWRRAMRRAPEKQPTSGSIRRFLGMIYFVKRRRRCSVIGTDVKQMRWNYFISEQR
jgi:hypothetical protein